MPADDRVARPHLSVVIPAYNEAARLDPTLQAIQGYLDRKGLHGEILVADDGSRDGTAEVARRFFQGVGRGRLLTQRENRGKGHAVRRGFLEARGRWVLMTDADLSTPIDEHERLAAAARDHDLDLAIGSRAVDGSQIEVRQTVVRETMGKTFNAVVRLATGLPFRDTQCGFKLMDRQRVLPLFRILRVDGFAFDVELLFLARRFGLRVREVPVVWRNDADTRVGLVGDPGRMLLDLARIRWHFRRGLYNPEVRRDPMETGT